MFILLRTRLAEEEEEEEEQEQEEVSGAGGIDRQSSSTCDLKR